MSEEIKEKIKAYYIGKDIDEILDYIINLQEKIKIYEKNQTYGDYVGTVNELAELKEENDRLSVELNENMIERNQFLSRNEKAIEFNKKVLKESWYGGYEKENATRNINILKGSDKE